MNEAGSGTTTYSYDTAGRLASLVNPFSETTSFVYDTLGRVGRKTLANGTSEHYAYDTRSRLTQVQLKQGATVLRTTGYAWDNADQITSQTVNGVTTNYGYDLAGQLTSEVRSGYNVAYTYDANGNRLSKTVNGTVESYTYDLADKMLTAGAKSYSYDAAGRTVGINAPAGTTTLNYDYESRVTAITGPGINETHTYNGLDTRVGTVQGGVSRTFVRDGSYVTDPVLRDGQATYTPGVSERRGGVSTWSHSGLKNADAQTTSVGAIAATRVYDAFGAELSATGTWKGPFGYAGGFGYQEDSSGLKLLGHRYYDPTAGRFLSRDKIKDGRNWYVYCHNQPLSLFDSGGLSPEKNVGDGLNKGIGMGILRIPGTVDKDGQMVIGEVIDKVGKKGTYPYVDQRSIHFDFPHGKPGYKSSVPHTNSELYPSWDHKPVAPWAMKAGNAKYIKVAGRATVVVGLATDAYDIANSTDPAAAAVKAGTVWGGAWIGATIGTSICPGVGTVIGGIIGAGVTSLIVYANE